MDTCQYEIQFQNEYMDILEKKIGSLLGISISEGNMMRFNKEGERFILRKKDDRNYMLFSVYKDSYVYLLIVTCEKKYEEKLRTILLQICDDIEDDYGEDHRKEVTDVSFKSDSWLKKINKKYDLSKIFGIS